MSRGFEMVDKRFALVWLYLISVTSLSTTEHENCGERLCLCRHFRALCVGHGRNLTYIPRLPDSITLLNFSHNLLENVTRHTFLNLTYIKLKKLSIAGNNISEISLNAFDDLKHLDSLELSDNPLSASLLENLLPRISQFPLQELILNSLGFGNKLLSILGNITLPKPTSLLLRNNSITEYFQKTLQNFHLQNIDLSYNQITKVHIYQSTAIQVMTLSFNRITQFPRFCTGNTSLNPSLSELYLDNNYLMKIDRKHLSCLTVLKQLTLSSNPISKITTNEFTDLQSLKNLHLRSLTKLNSVEEYAFNNSRLRLIDLRDNKLIMKHFHENAFTGCTGLQHLSLAYVTFSFVGEDKMIKLFHPLSNLLSLDMGNCGLRNISRAITNLRNLKFLGLYKNYISSWPAGTFDNLTNIQQLYLTANKITNIQENSFPENFREHLVKINLALNPFNCNCNILWFVNWFKRDRLKFVQSTSDYVCFSPVGYKNKKLIDITLSEHSCLIGYKSMEVIMFCTSLVMLLVISISLLYRFRWYIRYYVYMTRYDKLKQEQLWKDDLKYDAFVCYSAKDEDWVVDELMVHLEERLGFKLCIHGRDFRAGLITDLIVDSIKQSRKIILILSNDFAQSSWCQFELTVAQSHVLETGQDKLVVVMLRDIPSRLMSNSLHVLLKTNCYIAWPTDDCFMDTFWQRLEQSLIPP